MINFLPCCSEKAMANGNKPNHLCFKWGFNSGETANWHVPHNKVKSKNKIFRIDIGAQCCGSKYICWGILFLLFVFLASEERLSLFFSHCFSIQF